MSEVVFSQQIDDAATVVLNRAMQNGFCVTSLLVVTDKPGVVCLSYPDAKCVQDETGGLVLVFVQEWREHNAHYDPDDPDSLPYVLVENARLDWRHVQSSNKELGYFSLDIEVRTVMCVPWLGMSVKDAQYEPVKGLLNA